MKHAAESCKFIKYLIKSCIRLYFFTLFNHSVLLFKYATNCLKVHQRSNTRVS